MALFIVCEEKVDFDTFVNGKALSKVIDELDKVAAELGAQPLMSFFSMEPDEALSFLEDHDVELESIEVPEVQWFSAREGLATVRSLLEFLQQNVDVVANRESVVSDLQEFEKVLSQADAGNIRWYLAIDF